jgi:hypothetical protein
MSNSNFGQGFAKVSDYSKGLMNLCPCGQVVLAPAQYHEGKPYMTNPNKCKDLFDLVSLPPLTRSCDCDNEYCYCD